MLRGPAASRAAESYLRSYLPFFTVQTKVAALGAAISFNGGNIHNRY